MQSQISTALRLTMVTLLLTGLLYPLVVTGASQLLFPHQANGSLARDEKGIVVGSMLLGQTFTTAAYLQGRPSAAGNGYDATASSGSNLGPSSLKLRQRVEADMARLHKENPQAPSSIPADLLTTSASGLDPELSPAAALWQVSRIAQARQAAPERVRDVITARIQGRELGVLGEPRVNILAVNLALDRKFGRPIPAGTSPPSFPAAQR